jgi:hemin uptake protein HemP
MRRTSLKRNYFGEIPRKFGARLKPTFKCHRPMTVEDSAGKPASQPQERATEKPVSFAQLAGGKAELAIEHEGQLYRLRTTKNGKLLLNK